MKLWSPSMTGILLVLILLLLVGCHPTPTPTSVALQPTSTSTVAPPPTLAIAATPFATSISTPSPAPTKTTAPTRAPSPTPFAFTGNIHIAITQYIGHYDAEGRSDPSHPAKLLIFSDQNPTPEFVLTQNDTSYYDTTWSPDGKWLAYVERKGSRTMRLQLLGTDWQSPPISLTIDFPFGQLNSWTDYLTIRGWSADGTWLAFDYVSLFDSEKGYDSTTYVVNRQTKASNVVGHDVTAFAWSAAQPSRLAFAITPTWAKGDEYRAFVYLASVDTLTHPECLVCEEPKLYGKTVCSIAWSPVAETLAFTVGGCDGWDHSLDLWVGDLATRTWPVTKTVSSRMENLRWSKDGHWLAGGNAQEVWVFDATDWSVVNAFDVSPYGATIEMNWSDDGELVFTRPTKFTGDDLMILYPTTGVPLVLRSAASFGLSDSAFSLWRWYISK